MLSFPHHYGKTVCFFLLWLPLQMNGEEGVVLILIDYYALSSSGMIGIAPF